MWGAIGGATHRDNFQDFLNGKVVFGSLFAVAALASSCGPSALQQASESSLHGDSGIQSGNNYADIIANFRALSAKHENLTEIISYGNNLVEIRKA